MGINLIPVTLAEVTELISKQYLLIESAPNDALKRKAKSKLQKLHETQAKLEKEWIFQNMPAAKLKVSSNKNKV